MSEVCLLYSTEIYFNTLRTVYCQLCSFSHSEVLTNKFQWEAPNSITSLMEWVLADCGVLWYGTPVCRLHVYKLPQILGRNELKELTRAVWSFWDLIRSEIMSFLLSMPHRLLPQQQPPFQPPSINERITSMPAGLPYLYHFALREYYHMEGL